MRNQKPAERRRFFTTLASVAVAVPLGFLLAGTASASQKKTYKYRCTKCKLIQEYSVPGVKKCPNDGTTMIRMNS